MRIYYGAHAVTVDVTQRIRIGVTLDPGVWVVWNGNVEYSIVSLQADLDHTGIPHLTWPKARPRTELGWGRAILLDSILPRTDTLAAWETIPQPVRDVIEDAYLLARVDGLPSLFGAPA